MIEATVILGWIGIIIFLIIISTYQKLAKRNEYGFIHLLIALMYGVWLPIPIVLGFVLNEEVLIVGTVFGMVYLVMLVITMALQTGHIVHLVNQEQTKVWDERGSYMMATLSSPFEALAGVFKAFWAFFLGLAFWQTGNMVMAVIMFISSMFVIYFFINVLNASLVKPSKILEKVKPNPFVYNLETLFFFTVLIGYMAFVH